MTIRKTTSFKALILLISFGSWFGFGPTDSSSQEAAVTVKTEAELEGMFAKAETCAVCHSRAYEEWKTSYHSQAMVTIIAPFTKYIQEVEKEKGRFPNKEELMACMECHAPALRFASEELVQKVARLVVDNKKEELQKFSVDCAYCHTAAVTGKAERGVYYGQIEDPFRTAAHHSRYSDKITRTEFCASCHQTYRSAVAEVYCSNVYESWKASAVSAEKDCQSCHMKPRDGFASDIREAPMRVVRSHDFPGGHSPAMLQEAVRMNLETSRRDKTISLTVNIKSLAGHRFPDT